MNLIAKKVLKRLKSRKWKLVTVESCTGGALADAITSVPGSSDVFLGGLVAYSDLAKIKLGVRKSVLKKFSPYSEQAVEAMSAAGLRRLKFGPTVAVSVSGVLQTKDKKHSKVPVGQVWISVLGPGLATTAELNVGSMSRSVAKAVIVRTILKLILSEL